MSEEASPRDILLSAADALEGEALCLAQSHTKPDSDPLDWSGDEDAEDTFKHWMWLADNLRMLADR